jgi:UMF1 family MFS transporter
MPEGKNTEFFGFFNMIGKFATVLGPLLIAIVAAMTGDERTSIVIGGVLLLRVQLTPRVS